MGKLDGRVAIVTGASRGLGKDIALGLGREGATVVVVARTESEGQSRIPGTLDHTVNMIKEAGGNALAIRCDVSLEDDINRTVQTTLDTFGKLDILVNNAAILVPGKIMDMQPRHWNLIYRVNVNGPFLFCRAAIPALQRNGGGHIINITSRGSVGPGEGPYTTVSTGGAPYGSTKAALERFTQGLAAEVWQDRISVNTLDPRPGIWTEGGDYFRQGNTPANFRMSGEIFGDAAVLICAQEAGVFTGKIMGDTETMIELGGMTAEEVLKRYPVGAGA